MAASRAPRLATVTPLRPGFPTPQQAAILARHDALAIEHARLLSEADRRARELRQIRAEAARIVSEAERAHREAVEAAGAQFELLTEVIGRIGDAGE